MNLELLTLLELQQKQLVAGSNCPYGFTVNYSFFVCVTLKFWL